MPVRGEAGVGSALSKGFELPPMTLTLDELEALVLGVRVVQGVGDRALARAAGSLLAKVELVLPDTLRPQVARTRLAAPLRIPRGGIGPLGLVREALRSQRRLRFAYVDEAARGSTREVRPLTLAFWGTTWTLGAWCELRRDFRSFRVDRLRQAELARPFETEPGKSLDDFILAVARRDAVTSAGRRQTPAGEVAPG
jgi:predicted DNA-binding transcriptional regulator YafY